MTTITHLHRINDNGDQSGSRKDGCIGSFQFAGHDLRVAKIDADGEVWFIARDAMRILELKSRSSLAALPDEEKGFLRVHAVDTKRGSRNMTIVSEAGLYELTCASRMKEAKAFKRKVFREVLPSIRRTGVYAQPGVLPSGIDPAIRELLEVQRQILAVEQERLDLERAKHTLARFPEVADLERGAVRGKLTQMIEAVAMIRGRCSGPVWRELYLAVKASNHVDLYAQQASARRQDDRVGSIIQSIETWGLLDMVYTTARLHFMDEILAKPVEKRVPQLHVTEQRLPSAEERFAELTFDFAMGRAGDGPVETGSLN
jgi:prophage antirepressor-like protein